VIAGEGMFTPDDNVIVNPSMEPPSTSEGISGLPAPIPSMTIVGGGLPWTDTVVVTQMQKSRRMRRWATIGETQSRPGLLAVIEKSQTE